MINRRKVLSLVAGIALLAIIIVLLFFFNNLFNGGKGDNYLVRGVDLSAYQGEVDWDILADQKIDFAFIKATEGADYTDSQFEKNWKESQTTKLKVGAYLFLNYDASGKKQADHFIETVKLSKKNLPPVVDLELYGKYENEVPSKSDAQKILNEMLNTLEDHYKVKPIIYTTQRIFNLYLGDDYQDYKIWIVDLDNNWPKTLANGEEFTFWQYSHRGMLNGYDGDETFIDMNLYNGNYQAFLNEFF